MARAPKSSSLPATMASAGASGASRSPRPIAPAIVRAAREERIDLVVVGPEAPLAAALADRLGADGVPVFGPVAGAARIESSKWFAKSVMAEAKRSHRARRGVRASFRARTRRSIASVLRG